MTCMYVGMFLVSLLRLTGAKSKYVFLEQRHNYTYYHNLHCDCLRTRWLCHWLHAAFAKLACHWRINCLLLDFDSDFALISILMTLHIKTQYFSIEYEDWLLQYLNAKILNTCDALTRVWCLKKTCTSTQFFLVVFTFT